MFKGYPVPSRGRGFDCLCYCWSSGKFSIFRSIKNLICHCCTLSATRKVHAERFLLQKAPGQSPSPARRCHLRASPDETPTATQPGPLRRRTASLTQHSWRECSLKDHRAPSIHRLKVRPSFRALDADHATASPATQSPRCPGRAADQATLPTVPRSARGLLGTVVGRARATGSDGAPRGGSWERWSAARGLLGAEVGRAPLRCGLGAGFVCLRARAAAVSEAAAGQCARRGGAAAAPGPPADASRPGAPRPAGRGRPAGAGPGRGARRDQREERSAGTERRGAGRAEGPAACRGGAGSGRAAPGR